MERINPERIIEMNYLTLTSTASRIVDQIDLVTERINDTEELLEANSQAIPADQLEKAREIIETLKALTEQCTQATYQLLEIL
jgi:hypothetical protein